ncbi:MAG TPA: VOC family protein [Kineosporiaceae bacterium]
MTAKLYGITLDCPDPAVLGTFYGALTNLKETYASDAYVGLGGEGGPAIGFQRVEGFTPPKWPTQEVPAQLHLDFAVDDLDSAEAKAIELGATRAEPQPQPDRWRVLLDPAGHPFCLCKM